MTNGKEAVFGNTASCAAHVVMMARCERFRSVCENVWTRAADSFLRDLSIGHFYPFPHVKDRMESVCTVS